MNQAAPNRPFSQPTEHALAVAHLASPILAGLLSKMAPDPTAERVKHEAAKAAWAAHYLLEVAENIPGIDDDTDAAKPAEAPKLDGAGLPLQTAQVPGQPTA